MICSTCGASVAAGARFCPACGHRLQPAGDERRVVTVLFADLVGYTTFAETRDPERVKHLIDRWFERLAADIAAFGGRVDKIMGDAIFALFGAPVAHEDDAERAVRAALRMQHTLTAVADEAGVAGAQLRIGVNTGEVLVGSLRADGVATAMGDAVNLASRLQTSAQPGEVLVGPATWSATRHVIAYERRGEFTARGREGAVEVWAAVEPVLPPGSRPSRRRVALVGRDHEVALLGRAIDSALCGGRALLGLLVGDAGVGKTRLGAELLERAVRDHRALVMEGRCVPYGEANVWWPVADALRRVCRLEADAPAELARERVRERVRMAFGAEAPDSRTEPVVEGLLHLLGHAGSLRDLDPASAREEAIRALVDFVDRSTHQAPVVLLLSDLHWADDVVLDLIEELLAQLARRPFALLATARQPIRDRWAMKPSRHDTVLLNLDPLDAAAGETLLTSLLGHAPSAEVRDLLLERSGGNPFFIEELASLLEQRGAAGVVGLEGPASADGPMSDVPDVLRGLVAARLDALGEQERSVLTEAAVLGRRGSRGALRRLREALGRPEGLDEALDHLVEVELLEAEENEWWFRSDLVREVAYRTLPKQERATRHHGIALWIEARHRRHHGPHDDGHGHGPGDDLDGAWSDDEVEKLAHHFACAVELCDELGDAVLLPPGTRERAVRWLGEAAQRAESDDALQVAISSYDRGLALLNDPDQAERLPLLLGRSRVRGERWDLSGAEADAAEAERLADALGDERSAAAALVRRGDVARRRGDIGEAMADLSRAAERYAAVPDQQGVGEALRLQAMAALLGGDLASAESSATAALEAFESTGSDRGRAWALQSLAWLSFLGGRVDEAEARLDESLALFRARRDRQGIGWATGLLAFVRFQQGRAPEAAALAAEVLDESVARRDEWAGALMRTLLASIALWEGGTEEALEVSARALAAAEPLGDAFALGMALGVHGRALVMSGAVADGLAELARAPVADAALLTRACVHVHLGEPTEALAALDDLTRAASGAEMGYETQVARATALLQLCDEKGLAELEDVVAADGRPYGLSGLALGRAFVGDRDGAEEAYRRMAALPAATYLDLAVAELAVAAAAVRQGDTDRATEAVKRAWDRGAGTGDVVTRSLVALACHLFDLAPPGAHDGHGGLGEHDLGGWRQVLLTAAGLEPSVGELGQPHR